MTTTIALVDVYPMSQSIAEAFAADGLRLVRVQSTAEVPPVYHRLPDLGLFAGNVVHTGDLAATAAELKDYGVAQVLPGGETGVELADALAETMSLPGNGTELSAARRDKGLQQDAVRAAGIPVAEKLIIAAEDELAAWCHDHPGRVVVKPVRSAGNDSVTVCGSAEDAVAAYRSILGRKTIFGEPNVRAIAQEYLTGPEFAVNTVSSAGRHEVTDVWRYAKMTVNGVVDRHCAASSVPVTEATELTGYVFAVLDALAIGYGPAHAEVVLTDAGPRLVEIGARMCGAGAAYYAEQIGAASQLKRTVDAYLDPAAFAAEPGRHRSHRHAAMAFLTAPVAGRLIDYPLLDEVRALDSFHRVHLGIEPGQQLPKTVDDATEPLMIGLVHDRAEVVEADLRVINYLDGPGFYRLAD